MHGTPDVSRWAKPEPLGEGDTFEALHEGLTVRLIMTPRPSIATCRIDEPTEEVVAQLTEDFDFLPVEDADGNVVAVFDATAAQGGSGIVREHAQTLGEPWLVSADANLLDFMTTADRWPCRLVASGSKIAGLVNKSDLQRLPVRAALFALITGLELTMTEAIRAVCGEDRAWRRHLKQPRLQALDDSIRHARKADAYVDDLLFTQLADKKEILLSAAPLLRSKRNFEAALEDVGRLRDALAHANDYADTPEKADAVCTTVRAVLKLRQELAAIIEGAAT